MNRPIFPKRVLITAGMPYGSKELHFGHIGGVFVHADFFARFLRDRIGKENVMFVSGTDCYGSPIVEKFRTLQAENEFCGTISEFVKKNHDSQRETLKNYLVDLNIFAASGLDDSGKIHSEFSIEFFDRLYKSGFLKVMSTKQFFDEERQTFLNGRQVVGRCPIEGCKSEQAYADECSLGHQFFPEELIAPKSMLTGKTPVLKEVKNWYFDMESFFPFLKSLVGDWESDVQVRKFVTVICNEFLKQPQLVSKKENLEGMAELLKRNNIDFDFEIDEVKNNCKFTFKKLEEREKACLLLANGNFRFRTGKTIVPLRISGNVDWGVKVPDVDGITDLTFWVWPESLWAPISFTKTLLKRQGKDENSWTSWWCCPDSQVVQFIGEDNIYFYALAEMAMFKAVDLNIKMPTIVANKHILFFDAKASSSGKIKPPMAEELLQFYSPEQLRAHFLGLGLNNANVPFQPKPYNPQKNNNQGDPVFKEWSIFTNFLNRAVRTLFYSFQKYNNGNQAIPLGNVSLATIEKCKETILNYENLMYTFEFNSVMVLLEDFFKFINRFISDGMSEVQKSFSWEQFNQIILDGIHLVKTATILSHPIAPESTLKVFDYLNLDQKYFDWQFIFEPIQSSTLKFLEPKTDFFVRPAWQYN